MRADWRKLPFEEAMADETGGNIKTQQGEFQAKGRYPIVDQGKALIGGYTDDPDRLCKAHLPVIVFGDHTRSLKFVDFPFCLGADGTKILRPRVEAHEKYLFHYLRQIQLPDAGYDRHFKYLKRRDIWLPPIDEQRRIAAVLDQADELRWKRQRSIKAIDNLPTAIFADMFSSPSPAWRKLRLQEVVKSGTIITYGIVQAGEEFPGGVPYIRTGDIADGEISLTGLRHTNPAIASRFGRSRVCTGEIVMSIRATVGTTALVPQALDGANLTQGTARISPGEQTDGLFLLSFLRASATQRWIQQQVKGATFREITLSRLRDLPVQLPPLDLQREFAARVRLVHKLKSRATAHLGTLDALFASLEDRAFRGELFSTAIPGELEAAG
jgi:type I restriction enzyme S subunit